MQETPREPEFGAANNGVEELSPQQRRKVYWLGVGVACVVGIACVVFFVYISYKMQNAFEKELSIGDTSMYFGLMSLITIPITTGAVAGWIWCPLRLSTHALARGSWTVATCGLLLSTVFSLRAMAIFSLVFVPALSSVIFPGCVLGNWLARYYRKREL